MFGFFHNSILKFKHFKEDLYQKYPYLLVQLFFTWFGYKVLGFLKILLLLKLCLTFALFILLFFYWHIVLPYFINNIIFQVYLFTFYILINKIGSSNFKSFILGFVVGFFLHTITDGLLYSTEILTFSIVHPFLDYLFISLLLISFFKRFNESIILDSVKDCFNLPFAVSDCLCWLDIVSLQHNFFFDRIELANQVLTQKIFFSLIQYPKKGFPVKNSLIFFTKFLFENFPISKNYIIVIQKLQKYSFEIIGNSFEKYNKSSVEFQKGNVKDLFYRLKLIKTEEKKILELILLESRKLNNDFCRFIWWGLILGYLTSFLLFHSYLFF